MLLTVVIPVYNEASHFEHSLAEIIQNLSVIAINYEIIIIDDGSQDNTWNVLLAQCKAFPQVKAARLSRNFGKEAALVAGLEHAKGNAIVIMDGDLQHPPTLIAKMVELWRDGAEIVEAVKEYRGRESVVSRARSSIFYAIFSRLTGFDLRGASDFKLMDRRVLGAWGGMKERNLFFRGMNEWLGFKRTKIKYRVEGRAGGKTGWSTLQLLRLSITAVASFSSIPLYILPAAGLGFGVFALALGVQTILRKVAGQAVDGFTTVILLLLVIGCGLMLGLGILGVYIARIYEEVKQRPRYIIAEWDGDAR